jgi:hypothetical protein
MGRVCVRARRAPAWDAEKMKYVEIDPDDRERMTGGRNLIRQTPEEAVHNP